MIQKYLLTQTSKDSFYLLVGAAFSTLLNFITLIILANNLDTSFFGFIITGLIFVQLITDIFELGINPATLTYASSSNDKKIIENAWILKVGINFIVGLVVFSLAPLIATLFFHSVFMVDIIRISAIGIFLLPLITWGQTVLQARKNFLFAAIISSSSNVFRLVILLIVLSLRYYNHNVIYFSLQVVLLLSVFLVLWKLPFLLQTKIQKSELKKIMKFGFPIGISFALAALYTKLDQIMVLNLTGSAEAGVYGLANRLTLFFILSLSAFSGAISPRFASLAPNDFPLYFKKTLFATACLVIVACFAIVLGPFLIPIIFSPKYVPAIVPFQILMIGVVFFIIASPFTSAIVYTFKNNKFSFFNSLISLGIVFILLSFLVPQLKSTGAAITMAVVYFVQMIFSITFFQLQKKHGIAQ